MQARLGSKRLPQKVLADIGGQRLIDRVVDRATQIGYPVCVATPSWEFFWRCYARQFSELGVEEKDVLGRYVEAARQLRADHIIRVTADCPFLDVEAARWTVQHHLQTGADFTHYVAEGRGVEVFTREALEESYKLAPRGVRFYHEHPDEWILHNPRRYHIETMKFSVDTAEDLELARRRAMATNKSNVGFKATLGQVAKNRGGTHGGINPAGAPAESSHKPTASSGNPGLQLPWDGADASDKPGALPPLKSL